MKNKLSVAFLWHMHQPLYKDLVTGKYHLPWVRLHSTYSYLDMADILKKFPEVKVTFNLTPSLIWQLEDISGDDPGQDEYLELTKKNAADLTDEDRCFILKNFFSCDYHKAIEPMKKYAELFSMRGDSHRKKDLLRQSSGMSVSDFRDLQVLFNLAWCGFTLKDNDKLVKGLIHKGSGYTEEEKLSLLKRQKEVVASILPMYKKLQDEGTIEISTSPFYHPILPLLCRGQSGEGYDFKEDARVQVNRAVEYYEKVFGTKPRGMWPSEGSVSQEMIPVLAEAGIKWMATDEAILLRSFTGKDIPRQDLIYRAFTAREDGKEIDMVFRDINISNAISFRYSHIPAKKASANLIHDINGIARAMGDEKGERVAAIILDGENPWPYYPDGGKKFLTEIYSRLSSDKEAELVTIGGYMSSRKERKKIDKLFSGSWINHNFRKWIGSPQKTRAWEYLFKAREALMNSGKVSKEAMEELYIAEGSDWFWWYDEFGTELNFIFDDLFRLHLTNIYEHIGKKVPYYLSEPVPSGPFAKSLSDLASGGGEMARQHKVLIVSSEAVPFAKTGGLADVIGSLPHALASLGCDVRVIMPLYKCISDGGHELSKELSGIKDPFPDKDGSGKAGFDIYTSRSKGVTTYFIDHEKYFARKGLYGTPEGDFPDNGKRFAFFSRAVLDTIKAIDFKPDIIHCNDWQSALIPFYLKFRMGDDSFYHGIKTLFTIHNMAYQGICDRDLMGSIDIPDGFFNRENLEYHGELNFMKSGILYSDAVNTVSRRYAEEIMTPRFGCGLEGLLRMRKDILYGILNGVDYSIWSPRNDRSIKANFGPENIEKKTVCKKDLLKYTGLKVSPDKPLLGCITRLVDQKGMDLVANIMSKLVASGAGIVILGSGSDYYNRSFSRLAERFPENLFVCSDFNDELAHKIEAGCDIFLMPSRYEPCGLNHIYSIKYGTVPVVRATGGLDEVIIDYDENTEQSNGFKFGPATAGALSDAVERAMELYKNKTEWKNLMLRGMSCDFSWEHSAQQYMNLYNKITG